MIFYYSQCFLPKSFIMAEVYAIFLIILDSFCLCSFVSAIFLPRIAINIHLALNYV